MPHLGRFIGTALSFLGVVWLPVSSFAGQTVAPARTELAITSNSSVPALKLEIDAILARELLPVTNVGIKVVSLKDGDTIYEFNPRLLLVPASTQKVFTAAAALALLGPDREVATTVALDAAAGRVYLKGCGDSMVSAADLAALAAAAARALDRGGEYTLAADLSCFDGLYRGSGWMWDDDEFLITPLSVNQNAVSVLVRPGSRQGAPATVSAEPATSYVTLENLARTGAGGEQESIKAARRPGERDNLVTISGTIPLGSGPLEKRASVWRPELMALSLFRDDLLAQGIKVAVVAAAPAPAVARVVARASRRVGELVRFGLKTSDNLTAENLLKLLGRQSTGQPGSAEAGSQPRGARLPGNAGHPDRESGPGGRFRRLALQPLQRGNPHPDPPGGPAGPGTLPHFLRLPSHRGAGRHAQVAPEGELCGGEAARENREHERCLRPLGVRQQRRRGTARLRDDHAKLCRFRTPRPGGTGPDRGAALRLPAQPLAADGRLARTAAGSG